MINSPPPWVRQTWAGLVLDLLPDPDDEAKGAAGFNRAGVEALVGAMAVAPIKKVG